MFVSESLWSFGEKRTWFHFSSLVVYVMDSWFQPVSPSVITKYHLHFNIYFVLQFWVYASRWISRISGAWQLHCLAETVHIFIFYSFSYRSLLSTLLFPLYYFCSCFGCYHRQIPFSTNIFHVDPIWALIFSLGSCDKACWGLCHETGLMHFCEIRYRWTLQ